MTVFCGPSGSGKSSLAMDTIYAEGQRRYVESLRAYARQFVGQMQKPQLEHIEGLSPAIAIEQKQRGPHAAIDGRHGHRDLRLPPRALSPGWAAVLPRVRRADRHADRPTRSIDKIMAEPDGTQALPDGAGRGRRWASSTTTLWDEAPGGGLRARAGRRRDATRSTTAPTIDRRRKHDVEVVVDRDHVCGTRPAARIADSVENALALGPRRDARGLPRRRRCPRRGGRRDVHSQHLACERCGRSFEPLSPHNFSFNSSLGWCPALRGAGHANRRQSGRPAPRPEADARPRAPCCSGPTSTSQLFAGDARRAQPPHGRADRRAVRAARRASSAAWSCTAPARSGLVWKSQVTRRIKAKGNSHPSFSFQYKGLYPALEEASRLSVRLRTQLEHLVDEVECSECGGSRLRDDAAAVRFRERTIDEVCRMPLGRTARRGSARGSSTPREQKIAGELVREISNRLPFLVDVGLEYLTLGRRRPRSPAARRSGFAWPARSAAACAACCTCSTSRRSACTRATTRG